ncbi:ABC transporter [Pseudomonas citronellolis]|jgi:lipopolysaccharide transport system permease protein|uniref:Transport permease protein n=1 Tax=Pseudomonas citronellolis TaxID=53408 RepID=A0A1A9KKD3_9PSED|nr:ABC transporter permease [Pseudomonas citronellolis]ANI17982.1 ABC transporter [Pseudomonas citronellolis]
MWKSLWQYRHFVLSSIRNELISRFSRSKLGGIWMIINPLVQVAIYALILSNVLAAKLPGIDNKYAYAIYLTAGTIGWSLFQEIVSRCLTVFIDNGNLMKKMRFPRVTLPAIVIGSSLLNNGLLIISAICAFAIAGHIPNLEILWLIPLTLLVILLATGIGLLFGILNVFVRDIGQVIPIFLQVLFWFTPIVYPANIIPKWLSPYLNLNPMAAIIGGYHDVLLYSSSPNMKNMLTAFVVAIVLLLLSLFLFRKATPEMVDAL